MLYKFNLFISLILQIMSISSLSSYSTVQYTINNSSTYVQLQHFELIFATFSTLVNAYFDKIITTNSPKSHNPVKNMYFIQFLPIMLALCSMLLLSYYPQNYAGMIGSNLVSGCFGQPPPTCMCILHTHLLMMNNCFCIDL